MFSFVVWWWLSAYKSFWRSDWHFLFWSLFYSFSSNKHCLQMVGALQEWVCWNEYVFQYIKFCHISVLVVRCIFLSMHLLLGCLQLGRKNLITCSQKEMIGYYFKFIWSVSLKEFFFVILTGWKQWETHVNHVIG